MLTLACVCAEGLQHRDGSSPGRWQKLASLVDALESVTDIEFAPSHLGLKLVRLPRKAKARGSTQSLVLRAQASASGDGYVRVYEAADVTNITYWTLQVCTTHACCLRLGSPTPSSVAQERFQPAAERGVSSLSWNESRFDPPQLLLGLTDGAVQVRRPRHCLHRRSWPRRRHLRPRPQIWTYNDTHRRWQQHLEVARGGADTVHDVAWAPCMGRCRTARRSKCACPCVTRGTCAAGRSTCWQRLGNAG